MATATVLSIPHSLEGNNIEPHYKVGKSCSAGTGQGQAKVGNGGRVGRVGRIEIHTQVRNLDPSNPFESYFTQPPSHRVSPTLIQSRNSFKQGPKCVLQVLYSLIEMPKLK